MSQKRPPPLTNEKFLELFAAAKADDDYALGDLLTAFRAQLKHYAHNYIEPAWHHILWVSDLVQITFAKALPRILALEFTSAEAFRGWLETMLRNAGADVKRAFLKEKRDIRRDRRLDDKGWQNVTSNEVPPGEDQLMEIATDACKQAISELTDQERRALVLALQLKMPWKAVGDDLGLSAEAARKLATRANQKIEVAMEKSLAWDGGKALALV